ncbi:hypothetical protein [Martelella mediterranea]|uniref:hypothetical protein n=1 Tax=Martelella mediterranea TaxID=293089 RepID=UPI001404A412|nr:hypothetical protein [Martelella mediterranea]
MIALDNATERNCLEGRFIALFSLSAVSGAGSGTGTKDEKCLWPGREKHIFAAY